MTEISKSPKSKPASDGVFARRGRFCVPIGATMNPTFTLVILFAILCVAMAANADDTKEVTHIASKYIRTNLLETFRYHCSACFDDLSVAQIK